MTEQFDCLAVTHCDVFPVKSGFSVEMKALATVVINDQLILRGLRVRNTENGPYVAYPNDPFYKGEDYHSLFTPITRQLRDHIEAVVLEKYAEVTK